MVSKTLREDTIQSIDMGAMYHHSTFNWSTYFHLLLAVLTLLIFGSHANSLSKSAPCGRLPPSSTLTGPGILTPVDIPWTATITVGEDIRADQTFPAILVSPSLVLTKAHYFFNEGTSRFRLANIKSYLVTLGSRSFGGDTPLIDPQFGAHNKNGNTSLSSAWTTGVTHIRLHPGYKDEPDIFNSYALFHLENVAPVGDAIQPICLPGSEEDDLIQELESGLNTDPYYLNPKDDLILTGWNRGMQENLFLRMTILPPNTCLRLWDAERDTNSNIYGNRLCASVSYRNNHTTCIHWTVGAIRLVKENYYLIGSLTLHPHRQVCWMSPIASLHERLSYNCHFFRYNATRICRPGAIHYFCTLGGKPTLSWIEDNIKCGPHNFTCSNGQCIPISGMCDKNVDCDDESDEEANVCRGFHFCTEDEFGCGVYGKCIPKSQVRDGVRNCENGEDEDGYKKPLSIARIATGVLLSFLTMAGVITFFWKRRVKLLKKEYRNLTENEVNEFIHGCENLELAEPGCEYSSINYIQSLPWNSDYDIPFDSLHIGEEINRGNFGIVYKGILMCSDEKEDATVYREVEVAVKAHQESIGVQEFKILLKEIKILAYIGQHPNVVQFFGACTGNIQHREIFLVVEYCAVGNIKDFLQRSAHYFADLTQDGCGNRLGLLADYQLDRSQYGSLGTAHLILWSIQIADGMKFLASKNVVHADLSGRNVLLSTDLIVKITDFGLSRQLSCSGIYVKTSDAPVAWKWSAIETLMEKTFSEKTDVWSFGILLWELFSLGETPYVGTVWSQSFMDDLIEGKRLSKPELASTEIFQIMSSCWEGQPENRPTFTCLRENLSNLLKQ